MHCAKRLTEDLIWVGANDRRLAMFEGVYSVPAGVSYNAYLITDEKTALIDTVDRAVGDLFFENLAWALGGRKLDYVIVQHMEPDHSATLDALVLRYPDVKVVCGAKAAKMLGQFFPENKFDVTTVAEGDVLSLGKHELTFAAAPMVHWPEVMVTYDRTDGTLFSADAFGTFGALNGAIWADEVDFFGDYLGEARRYYCNIVGKYGAQVRALLEKAAKLDIKMLCPLHGFVWRERIGDYIDKYVHWSGYEPEEQGVMIAYASVYGHTANAAEKLSCLLRDRGIATQMFDVSVTPASEIVAAAFRWSHLVFASTTYNAGVFVTMEALLQDLAAHNLSRRTVALVENGSWGPTAAKEMRAILSRCRDITFTEQSVTLLSALRPGQEAELEALADELARTLPQPAPKPEAAPAADAAAAQLDPASFFKFSYGLFVLSAREGEKDNGCIINTAQLLTDSPKQITVAVNKANLTHDMILRTGRFNISILSEHATFDTFKHFGFQSGRTADKFAPETPYRTPNGIAYVADAVNAVMSAQVVQTFDAGTHTLFIARVEYAAKLNDDPSMTYAYYFDHVKPKPIPTQEKKKGFVCKICGYVYEGDELPADFVCPLCKHGADDFEPLP